MSKARYFLTCEHGGYKIPARMKTALNSSEPMDHHSHWDPGALEVSRFLHRQLNCPLFYNKFSRRVVDCNRSDTNPSRFSTASSRPFSNAERSWAERNILQAFKTPVRRFVQNRLRIDPELIWISVHSFTPRYRGKLRKTEIGLLYRPWIENEVQLARALQAHLREISNFKVDCNLPYRGHTDCFLNELTDEVGQPNRFFGVMLELNFGLQRDKSRWEQLKWSLATAISATIG